MLFFRWLFLGAYFDTFFLLLCTLGIAVLKFEEYNLIFWLIQWELVIVLDTRLKTGIDIECFTQCQCFLRFWLKSEKALKNLKNIENVLKKN